MQDTVKGGGLDRLKFKIPITVFSDRSLSVMEVLVEYLKERQELTFSKIAFLLNRDDRTIWTVYYRVQKKRKKLSPEIHAEIKNEIKVPILVFDDRSLSFFETLVEYLKNELKLSYHEIASLLNRDDRTIWTLYDRCVKKRSAGHAPSRSASAKRGDAR